MIPCEPMLKTVSDYKRPEGHHWGKIVDIIDGYQIVRYRRRILVYCPCGKAIVGEFPQRGNSKLRKWCYHCWREIPTGKIKSILKDKGFGVSP